MIYFQCGFLTQLLSPKVICIWEDTIKAHLNIGCVSNIEGKPHKIHQGSLSVDWQLKSSYCNIWLSNSSPELLSPAAVKILKYVACTIGWAGKGGGEPVCTRAG